MESTVFLNVAVVVFDSDGVLVDSRSSVDRAWRRWAIGRGLDPEDVLESAHSRPSRETVTSFVPRAAFGEALAEIDRLELHDAGTVREVLGATTLLAALPPDRWAVVTSATRSLARARLRAAGIPPPPILVTADDVSRGKPDPEGYVAALRRLGVVPAEAAVIEDSSGGIAAARAAGVATIVRVGSGGAGHGAVAVVPDLRSVTWRGGLWIATRTDARCGRG